MPQVQLPDGNLAEFPDSMSTSDIEAVIAKQYPKQEPMGVGGYLKDAAKSFGSGMVRAIPYGIEVGGSALATGYNAATKGLKNQSVVDDFMGNMNVRPVNSLIDKAIGPEYDPKTGLGYLTKFAGGFVGPGEVKGGIDALRLSKGFFRSSPYKTTAELKAAKDAAYKAVENSGTVYDIGKLQKLAVPIQESMGRAGYDPVLHQGANRVVNSVLTANNPSMAGIDSIIQKAYAVSDAKDAAIAQKAVKPLFEFMDNPANVLEGAQNAGLVSQARSAQRAYKASELADTLEGSIKNRPFGTSRANKTLNEFTNLKNDEQAMAYLTPAQRAGVEKVTDVSKVQRGLYEAGRLAPNSLIGAGSLGAYYYTGDPTYLLGGAVGIGAKGLLSRSITKKADEAYAALRGGYNPSKAEKLGVDLRNGVSDVAKRFGSLTRKNNP